MKDNMQVSIIGELRPDWLIKLEDAVAEAEDQGWHLDNEVKFIGHPYEFRGELHMASWTVAR